MLGWHKGRSDQTVTIYDGHFIDIDMREYHMEMCKKGLCFRQVAGAAACGCATADFSGELMGARVSAFKFE